MAISNWIDDDKYCPHCGDILVRDSTYTGRSVEIDGHIEVVFIYDGDIWACGCGYCEPIA